MHYIIIIIIIAIIITGQFAYFFYTCRKIRNLKTIFPESNIKYTLDSYVSGEPRIVTSHQNQVLATICGSINSYLQNNTGAVSDYHLIKDIVERNCDASEDEIDTQIPVPLYMGLAGTMLGILFGVGLLVKNGGLEALLNYDVPSWFVNRFPVDSSTDTIKNAWTKEGTEGVETLLGGVAIAMGASFVGIVLTTIASWIAKSARTTVEENKNTFLSWLQANLLPKLSDGAGAILDKVSRNLNQFNATFSQNTRELRETFGSVKDIYRDLSSVLNAINHLRINDLAKYNIMVYEKMKNSADEIGILGEQLKGVNQYLQTTNHVVEKLDAVFEREISQFDQRIGVIKKVVGEIDNGIGHSLAKLGENSTFHLNEFIKSGVKLNEKFGEAIEGQQSTLQEAIVVQRQLFEDELLKQEVSFNDILDKQNKALAAKSKEIESIVAELQNLSAVKNGINNLEKSTKEQNGKLDRLIQSIEKLAQMKVNEGGVVSPWDGIPIWVKISGFSIGGCIAITGLFFVFVTLFELI